MSRFTEAGWAATGDLKSGRPLYGLTTPLVYEVGFKGSGWEVAAPEGFRTDLASLPIVPRPPVSWRRNALLRRVQLVVNRIRRRLRRLARQLVRAAIVHDRLRQDRRWPKLLGDYVFWEAMGVERMALGWRVVCALAVLVNFNRD